MRGGASFSDEELETFQLVLRFSLFSPLHVLFQSLSGSTQLCHVFSTLQHSCELAPCNTGNVWLDV